MTTLENTGIDLSGIALVTPSPDPMRPADTIVNPLSKTPPSCPTCCSLLYAVDQNHSGDLLFECMNDGYVAVFRRSSGQWEQRPGTHGRWAPPLSAAEAKKRLEKRPA